MSSDPSVLIVGGGIIGTMHAVLASEAGYKVTHLERDPKPLSASVRNFGLIWVSGRQVGPELALALRARELWEGIGSKADIGFRGNGSLTIATNEAEHTVLKEAIAMEDSESRGFELLNQNETKKLEPLLAGKYIGALRCTKDGAVEPNLLLGGLREYLQKNSDYTWVPNFEVSEFAHSETGNHVFSKDGRKFSADLISICVGAEHKGFLGDLLSEQPIRKVHLQMAATVPIAEKLGHSIADGDSLRYYPAFKDLSLDQLPPQPEVAAKFKMQLLLAQRFDGSFTIGDTHEYDEPFTHEIYEEPYRHLLRVIEGIFGRPSQIERRWSGVYSQTTGPEIYTRVELAPGAVVVTGGGGRGNTLSPAIAEETINSWAK